MNHAYIFGLDSIVGRFSWFLIASGSQVFTYALLSYFNTLRSSLRTKFWPLHPYRREYQLWKSYGLFIPSLWRLYVKDRESFKPQKYVCTVLWSTTTLYDVVTLWFHNIVIDAVYNVVYTPVYNAVIQYDLYIICCLQCSKPNDLKYAHLVYNPVYNLVTMWLTLWSTKTHTKRLTTWSTI